VDLAKELSNEFAAKRLHDKVMTDFASALQQMAGSPGRAVFTVSGAERLGSYDEATGRFPLTGDLMLKQAAAGYRIERRDSKPAACTMGYTGGPEFVQDFKPMHSISLAVSGAERLTHLPVDPSTAESLVKDRGSVSPGVAGKGMVRLELSVEVDGRLGAKPKSGYGHTVEGRIVGARALELPSGRELYVYPASLFAPSTTTAPAAAAPSTSASGAAAPSGSTKAPAAAASGAGIASIPETLEMFDALPLTNSRETLLILKYMPELLNEETVLSLTRTQIGIEQQVRRAIEKLLPRLKSEPEFNKRQPAFLFEWRQASESDPQTANAILGAFINEEPDWSFVKRAPSWDDRFTARIDTFVFGPEPIQWEQMDFAARELGPVYRRFLEQATERTPSKVWFEVGLPVLAYDFKRGALGFVAKGRPGGARDLHDVLSLMHPVSSARLRDLPAGAKAASIYGFPQPVKLPVKRPASSPSGADRPPSVPPQWRERMAQGARASGGGIALDRHLELTGIPMSAEAAESQLRCSSTARARVFIDVQGIEGKTEVPKSGGGPRTSTLFKATVQRVVIVDDKGHILADLAADAFKRR
jgi:hypothetical protein